MIGRSEVVEPGDQLEWVDGNGELMAYVTAVHQIGQTLVYCRDEHGLVRHVISRSRLNRRQD